MRKLSLNLAETYIPDWGVWEAAREVVCNAIDADPEWKMEVIDSDHIRVTTTTAPSLHELMIIGATTKRDSTTIGQFGEGMKLAALVTTRMGGRLTAQFPGGKVVFKLHKTKGFASRVLYAHIDDKASCDGCVIDIELPGVALVADGRFIPREQSRIDKRVPSLLKIFSKGVYITTEEDIESLWDWNLDFTVNRDRMAVRTFDLKWEIGHSLTYGTMTLDDYRHILTEKCFEMEALCSKSDMSQENCGYLKEAFRQEFGEKCVLATDSAYNNSIAEDKGFKVNYALTALKCFGIPTVDDVLEHNDIYVEIPIPPKIAIECTHVLDILETPLTIKVFEDFQDAPQGSIKDKTVWLSEKLLMPGNRTLRFSTIAHECAHYLSMGGDGSPTFEFALDRICGKLLNMLIKP